MSFGHGIFQRRTRDMAPAELASLFDWTCTPVLGAGERLGRSPDWWTGARRAGVITTGMHWLPTPQTWRVGLLEALDFLASVGAAAFVTDPELAWKGAPAAAAEYMATLRSECDRRGLALGFTSYGWPQGHRTFPWAQFVPLADFCIPQVYDREGERGPEYVAGGVQQYRDLGARVVVAGLGAFTGSRWRTPAELAHEAREADIGAPGLSRIWWPPAGRPPEAQRATFRTLRGGGAGNSPEFPVAKADAAAAARAGFKASGPAGKVFAAALVLGGLALLAKDGE